MTGGPVKPSGPWTYRGCSILWFDMWVGLYFKPDGTRIYFCPLPCVVFIWGRGDYKV